MGSVYLTVGGKAQRPGTSPRIGTTRVVALVSTGCSGHQAGHEPAARSHHVQSIYSKKQGQQIEEN